MSLDGQTLLGIEAGLFQDDVVSRKVTLSNMLSGLDLRHLWACRVLQAFYLRLFE